MSLFLFEKKCLNLEYTILSQKPAGPVDFASELAKKIGVAPVMKPPSPVAADSNDEEERIERKGDLLLYSLEILILFKGMLSEIQALEKL